MKKGKSILSLILVIAVTALFGMTCVLGLDLKGMGAAKNINLGLDLEGGVSITYQVKGDKPSQADMDDTVYKLQKRVEQYSTEAQAYQVGDNRISIEIPGVSDANKILEELGQPGSLYFIKHKDSEGNENYSLTASGYTLNKSIDELKDTDSIVLTGTEVKTASAGVLNDSTTGNKKYGVDLELTDEGAEKFKTATEEAYNNNHDTIAIYYDGALISVPSVNAVIENGKAQISGNMDYEEADNIASTIRIGGLNLELEELSSEVVGAQLGQDALKGSLIAGAIGLAIVCVFMCWVYLLPGLASSLALILYTELILILLNAFDITLTLPGIAGIILGIGMAVDANVLIYERTKEELRAGKSLGKAIADGYGNAFSAIFDSNLTSIITGIVLFYFGTDPIRGFATTMIIGLVASFLTAVFLTRIVYEALLAKDKLKNVTFTTSITKDLLTNPKINFLAARKVGYLIPAGIIVLGAISMSTIGLNNGIDFTGGRNYVVRFDQDVKTDEVRDMLDAQLDGSVSVIQIGTPDQVRVSTNYKIDDSDPSVDQEIESKLFEGVKSLLPAGTTLDQFTGQYIQSSQKVGPSMADDIKNAAILAVIFAMICMAAYILLRFRDISFSVGAFASVAVTTLCIISFYTLLWKVLPFSMEVDQTFIAAILTIIGYSINDTVVVFDRIRETIGLYPKRDRYQVINDALNSTLCRTFNTSLTTLVVVLCIFILGGATIRSFTFAILLGIIIGTYSTLFVATPIAYELQKKKINKKAAAEAGK